ncbi:DNA circularization protein [Avibacterium paragallinarum]|uniref:DNA circulation N-terminal domain-containing protein n=1 Tax=Avibacterium paragallinarum TaxID=728 RepID=A0A8B3TFW8_AVIPA|nr:DNA circularization N-terminal domain-containing protein [Avibacterium paragallinarum]RZN61357.1 hypothetical protein EIG79_01070 [Avibacterium paragallinarum]
MRRKSGKGSFRGIPFLIEEQQDISGGRRLVQFEYPLRDDGLTEDLGLRLRNYHVSCLVIGDNYIKQAEKLIEALEKPDEGELKHPYFGTKTVRVEDYKTTYSTSEQRIARFEITFIPAINDIAPLAKKDTLLGALSQYADALNALADEFAEMIEEALAFLDELTAPIFELVDAFVGLIETVFDGGYMLVGAGMEFKNRLISVKNQIGVLIRTPKLLAKELQALVNFSTQIGVYQSGRYRPQTQYGNLTVSQNIDNKKQSAVESKRVFVWLDTMINSVQTQQNKLHHHYGELQTSDVSRLAQSQLQHQPLSLALARTFRGQSKQNMVALLQAKTQFIFLRLIQASLVMEYGNAIMREVSLSSQMRNIKITEGIIPNAIESKGDVQRYMNEINERLETLVFALADNEQWQSYDALEQYRLALLSDLRTRGELLAHSQTITLNDTQPALVVEFNTNGNARGWEKLSLRNHIRHPLFCVGGKEIEVLL